MRWSVEGADASSGHDVRITVEAETLAEAEAHARYNGILVSSVNRAADEPPPPPPPAEPDRAPTLDYKSEFVATRRAASTEHAPEGIEPASPELNQLAAASQDVKAQTLSYLTSETVSQAVPTYQGIVIAARMLNILGMVVGVFGLLLLGVGGLQFLVRSIEIGPDFFALISELWRLWPAIGLMIAAVLLRLIAALSLALRDVARNSYSSK